MDPKQQRQQRMLYGLLAVLAVVIVVRVLPMFQEQPAPAAPAAGRNAVVAGRGAKQPDVLTVPETEVRLASLEGERATPGDMDRNPFQFHVPRPTAPAVTQTAFAPPTQPQVEAPSAPAGPPPPAPIPLKFIGFASKASTGKIAAFTDGRGVYHGREGDEIEGQYRVVRIGEESVQIEYLDGRGRQTIRLTGS